MDYQKSKQGRELLSFFVGDGVLAAEGMAYHGLVTASHSHDVYLQGINIDDRRDAAVHITYASLTNVLETSPQSRFRPCANSGTDRGVL